MSNDAPTPPIAVRPITAAQMLDCSRAHVYQLIARGELRRLQLSGSSAVRIPVEDIYRVLGLDADPIPTA